MTRALALTMVVFAFAACGEDGNDGGGEGATGSERSGPAEGAFKFAKCMRDNGVDMPDPEVDGNRVKMGGGPGSGPNPESPQFQAAQKKCEKHLREGIGEISEEDKAQMRDAGVKYAECMRANGITGFPDPQPDGGIMIRRGQAGVDPESPKFQAAHGKCEQHMAEIRGKLEGRREGE